MYILSQHLDHQHSCASRFPRFRRKKIGEWIGELTESEVQDLDIALAVSLGMKCGPGQLDTDTLEHLNNLQAELDRTKAELREAKSGPDYKLLYDQLIEKMLSR